MNKKMENWLKNGNQFKERDEYYTPPILVEPIIKYAKGIIWCPFDTENSEFVIQLKKAGHKVIHSHIWEGKDFFEYEPNEYDMIISNPPYTRKLDVLERLYKLNKPFMILLGLPILNYQEIGNFFLDKELQLLIVDKKVSFDGNTSSFNSSYFCYRSLPKDLMFVGLKHNNTKTNFTSGKI